MIFVSTLAPTKKLCLLIEEDSLESFKTLVNRAMNCWDSAPAELKEFADMVTEGKVLQDYHSQP